MGKFFAEKGVDYGQTGWITDKGVFIPCAPIEHDKIAEKITGKPVKEVEKIWIRISLIGGKNLIQFEGKRINKKQHKALDDWGLMDFVERKRTFLSENFINAYFE